jgi:hypothetical protein
MLSIGYAFGGFTLGGCGGSQAGFSSPADGQLPEHVVDKLTDCSKQGPKALVPVEYTVEFDVVVTENGHVEGVQLRDSTLHLADVEACMTDALYGLSTSTEALSLRRRQLAPDTALAPKARSLFGQAEPLELVEVLLGAGATLLVGYVAYKVYVHYFVAQHHTRHRPHPAKPQTEEPPKPDTDPKPEPQGTTGPTPPLPPHRR